MIQTFDLSKHFGDLKAVNGMNLDIPQGEFFACLGPNGAGKTTTIKMLTGLMRPTSGQAMICGIDIQRFPQEAKALISYVPDFPFLYEKLTAKEFMWFIGDLYRLDRKKMPRLIDQLIEQFNLKDYQNEQIDNLSHGTKQRVAISSALLHDPKVIIIDEPMVGLDPKHSRILKDEFKRRSRNGTTIFFSTHALPVAEEVADRIGIIHQGKLLAAGTVDELRSHSGHTGALLEEIFLEITADAAAQSAS